MLLSDINVMKRRVSRLVNMAECLEYSVCPDIGLEQIDQLRAMSSELDAMQVTCVDRMLLSEPASQHTVRVNSSLAVHHPSVL